FGERFFEDRGKHHAVLPSRETDQPRFGVFGSHVVADESIFSDSATNPLFDGFAEVMLTKVCAGVRRMHHSLAVALGAVHGMDCRGRRLMVSARLFSSSGALAPCGRSPTTLCSRAEGPLAWYEGPKVPRYSKNLD